MFKDLNSLKDFFFVCFHFSLLRLCWFCNMQQENKAVLSSYSVICWSLKCVLCEKGEHIVRRKKNSCVSANPTDPVTNT